ncbi:hypothetical protein HYPSUDRAFT_36344 [Hypholoma sublateritium FD-334 SS-4]|uniref:Uncharacterized protein n=1 Tax=Hypholoma sublateritium (strain FD-334 SS-4) TaxID=945553 RepID=A0A0D2Q4Y6_HYPSF|nr:hypothetical protein HYPSUDRAFT_36344 [Hypholoma sublateritium FD-334 SS-4]
MLRVCLYRGTSHQRFARVCSSRSYFARSSSTHGTAITPRLRGPRPPKCRLTGHPRRTSSPMSTLLPSRFSTPITTSPSVLGVAHARWPALWSRTRPESLARSAPLPRLCTAPRSYSSSSGSRSPLLSPPSLSLRSSPIPSRSECPGVHGPAARDGARVRVHDVYRAGRAPRVALGGTETGRRGGPVFAECVARKARIDCAFRGHLDEIRLL